MKVARTPGVLLVAMRELRWMYRDRIALILAVGLPLCCFALLAWTFSNAVIRDLRIVVVDEDRTSTSMTYIQAIDAAPGVSVAHRMQDLNAAMHVVRSGGAIASVYIPAHFERDLMARKRPQLAIFYNRQFLTPGNNASSSIASAVSAATATLSQGSAGKLVFSPGPLVAEQYVLTNPALNYVQFLLRAVLPTVLHVIMTISAGYAVGSEFQRRSRRAWIRAAGGRPVAALAGKLLPLVVIFVLMMLLEAGIVHGIFDVPFRGNPGLVIVAACGLIVSYLALGAAVQLLVRNLSVGLSLSAIICSPAFGFVGIGFPVFAMNAFGRAWGDALPLRWYFEILYDQALRGLPALNSLVPLLILLAMAATLLLVALNRLTAMFAAPGTVSPRPASRLARPPSSMLDAVVHEIRLVFADPGARGLMIAAPVLYGLLYPQPYLTQILRDLPIAVVDQDHTDLSHDLIQNLDANEGLSVAVRADTLADARRAIARREAFAIVDIPEGTYRDVLKGNKARLAAYIDSAYFLLYTRIVQGIADSSAVTNAAIAAHGAKPDGSLAQAALLRSSPVDVQSEPLFNPTGGYGNAIVPAAFILIIQQTLLMGVASLRGAAVEQGEMRFIGRRAASARSWDDRSRISP
ncbi:ABC transporter permease [Tardiphaga alba]|uniref:ABC transporter permease n=1 Tax=Tardiphaga alba TaxID=340268 RepID=UPI002112FAA5|nr:ABC transporter permease [Tardiphaga alba]